jgi:hypothetical protein
MGAGDLLQILVLIGFGRNLLSNLKPVLFHKRHGMVLRSLVVGFVVQYLFLVAAWAAIAATQDAAVKPLTVAVFMENHASANALFITAAMYATVECFVAAATWIAAVPVTTLRGVHAWYADPVTGKPLAAPSSFRLSDAYDVNAKP